MDTENQTRPFNPIPLILISLGIWVPIIGALLTYYLSRDADGLSGSMALGSAVVLLAQVEIFAIIFLLNLCVRRKAMETVQKDTHSVLHQRSSRHCRGHRHYRHAGQYKPAVNAN
ncbi:Uncharacterized protein ALO82_00188 [Pseudomonas syringae pv. broussonetiae]|uniref:Uncharacterized protein n=1 Tax=Pseudomonas savastanoi TaxID=29438 RepID=A0A3M5K5B6_PSESS|nr:Uncharacterized protein ALO82_00188 [Pseudomonas syringae pv. broussonetiae]RMT30811.1 hypothetical protein ALP51_00491 [Pseudomonas savastanoi]